MIAATVTKPAIAVSVVGSSATRYDKRVDIYVSSILLAATVIWWIN
jgi:hypothetical protein